MFSAVWGAGLTDNMNQQARMHQHYLLMAHEQAAVYHRDLKLENALINISTGSAPYLKIADFGFSKVWAHPHVQLRDQHLCNCNSKPY